MRKISALGWVLVALVAVPAVSLALAPSNGAAQDISRAVAGGLAARPTLAPPQIMMEVRRAGFEPISRPVQRGAVYDEDKLVEGTFAYFASGYLRVTVG